MRLPLFGLAAQAANLRRARPRRPRAEPKNQTAPGTGTGVRVKVRRPKQVTYDFSGTSVLITGAAHGQGKLHALRFAEAGG